jgi:hypothetical protein
MKTLVITIALLGSCAIAAAQTAPPAPTPAPAASPAAPGAPQEMKCRTMVAHDERGRPISYEACANSDGKMMSCQEVQYMTRRGQVRYIRNCGLVDAPQ